MTRLAMVLALVWVIGCGRDAPMPVWSRCNWPDAVTWDRGMWLCHRDVWGEVERLRHRVDELEKHLPDRELEKP